MIKIKKRISFKPDNEINTIHPIVTRNELNLVKSKLWWTFDEMNLMRINAFDEYYRYISNKQFIDFKSALQIMYDDSLCECLGECLEERNKRLVKILNADNNSVFNCLNTHIKITKSYDNLQTLDDNYDFKNDDFVFANNVLNSETNNIFDLNQNIDIFIYDTDKLFSKNKIEN